MVRGVDVAKALGYKNPPNAVNIHCKKSIKSTFNLNQVSGKKTPPTTYSLIPESDVYRLIFSSKLESAEKLVVVSSRSNVYLKILTAR